MQPAQPSGNGDSGFQLWRLDNANRSVLLGAAGQDVPALLWFGERLNATPGSDQIERISTPPLPLARADQVQRANLFPDPISNPDQPPALRAHRHGGNFNQQLICHAVTADSDGLNIKLCDPQAAITVQIKLRLYDSGALEIKTDLVNSGADGLCIDWLASATVPLPHTHAEVLALHGRWGLEFQPRRHRIDFSRLLLENNRGRTGHELFPGLMSGSAGFSEHDGEVLAATLAWSGCHRSVVGRGTDGSTSLQTGVSLQPGELMLAAGERWQAPAVTIVSTRGTTAASHQLHTHLRRNVLPEFTRRARPVHANSWEALYFSHTNEKLLALIDASASIGAERFILDDGWFIGRRDDTAGLGDWQVDREIYPDGLQPIVDRVRQHGMQFGLWFEPEMVNPDSELYRQHPHWTLQLDGYTPPLARHQLALDMSNPEVQDYLFNCISTLVAEYKIDYIKWDCNRDLLFAGDGQHCKMARQPGAVYALMQRLQTDFPPLEIESCASGGARADWGILHYTGRVWTSDSIDAIDRLSIQRGYSLFCPPEIIGAHIGHGRAHLTGREIDLHTRAVVALQGQFGFELNAAELDKQEIEQLQPYVALYKENRDWIAEASTQRIDTTVPGVVANGLVAANQQRSLWFVVTTKSLATTSAGVLRLRGLTPELEYTVTLASTNLDHFVHFSKMVPAWITSSVSLPAQLLMTVGLQLPVMPAQSALLLKVDVRQ